MTTILYSSKIALLKRWFDALHSESGQVYIAKSRAELFEYFNTNKSTVVLVIENMINDEENEEFLSLLRRSYPHVKVCIFSHLPTVKEASEYLKLGIKGYANAYMQDVHINEAVQSVWNGKHWYLPKFLEAFFVPKDYKKEPLQIGKIISLEKLVIAKSQKEERIVLYGDVVFENEILFTPYENSKVVVKLQNNNTISLEGNDSIYLDESTFSNEKFAQRAIFDEDITEAILAHLGERELNKKRVLHTEAVQKKETHKKSKEGIIATYSGNFDEYDISPSKNLPGFFVVKDKVERRDGSDLISDSISKLVFADVTKIYDELISK